MTGILMPSGTIITPDALFVRHRFHRNNIDIEMPKIPMEGFYKLAVIRRDGTRRVETPWFKNLILDAGLDRYLGDMNYATAAIGRFKVGTGTTAPSNSQTALVAQVASSSNAAPSAGDAISTTSGGSTWWVAIRYGGVFSTGTLSGQALTEVGIGWTSTTCFSRALILPDGVNPGSITVLSDESLEVYYELRVYPVTSDTTGSITLAGTSHNFTIRPAFISSTTGMSHAQAIRSGNSGTFGSGGYTHQAYASGALGAVTGFPSGSGTNCSPTASSASAYTNGSFSRTHTLTYGLSTANTSGDNIQALLYYMTGVGAYQAVFSPVIVKGPTRSLRLDFTTTLTRRP